MVHDNYSDYRSPVKSELTATEEDSKVVLTHTVSFYRRQQSQVCLIIQNYFLELSINVSLFFCIIQTSNTPVRRVLHRGDSDSTTDDNEGRDELFSSERYIESQKDEVQFKIKSLLENVTIQQQQISQASNALNTCASTFEFSGSTESVVAEWKLLVASM